MARAKKGMPKDTEMTFEEAIDRLQAIVDLLEKGDVPLGEALGLFEEGVGLSKQCKKRLDEAHQRLEILAKGDEDRPVAGPYETGDGDDEEGEEGDGEEGNGDEDEGDERGTPSLF